MSELSDVVTIDSMEPPEYRQEMIDKWVAWSDAAIAAFQEIIGIGIYEAFPDADSVLWSMHRRGDEPEVAAKKWADIYLGKGKRLQPKKEITMTPGQTVLAACVCFAAGLLCFMFGYLLAMMMSISGRASDSEPMIPGEHEHLREE